MKITPTIVMTAAALAILLGGTPGLAEQAPYEALSDDPIGVVTDFDPVQPLADTATAPEPVEASDLDPAAGEPPQLSQQRPQPPCGFTGYILTVMAGPLLPILPPECPY